MFDEEEPLAYGSPQHEAERLATLGAAFCAIAHRIGGALNRIALFGQLLEVNLRDATEGDGHGPARAHDLE